MNNYLKKNAAVIFAFLLPILLIAFIGISTYLPSLLISTDYDFVYSSCSDGSTYSSYYCNGYLKNKYSVVDNKLVVNEIDPNADTDRDGVPDIKENYPARFFLHDTTKNTSREITLEEATSLQLDPLLTSPDGVTITSHYDRAPDILFLFDGGGSNYGHYLTNGKGKEKLNLINTSDTYYYRNNFNFVGWVVPTN